MADSLRILVTGIGGDLGQAMAKSLRLMDIPVTVIGTDAAAGSIGAAFADRAYQMPRADSPEYADALIRLVQRESVDALVPGSEAEIYALARLVHEGKKRLGCPLVCLPYDKLVVFRDKLFCFNQLKGNIDLPRYADGFDADAVQRLVRQAGFPCVVKSRVSCGSKSLGIAHGPEELAALVKRTPEPIVQEYIDGTDGEFTLGIYISDAGVQAIAFRRNLGPVGASWYAETVFDQPDVVDYAMAIAKHTGIKGSFNVQVRKGRGAIGLLEINARFSSLVAARAIAGFRDLEWSIKEALGLPYTFPESYRPLRFQRYLHEVIDFGEGYHGIAAWLPHVGK